jgi:mannose-6-phosphate isomerase-like protein (cupin superfamily)
MGSSVANYQARRVVTGTDDHGRSCVVADGMAPTRVDTPTFSAVDLWQTDAVPAPVDAEDTLTGTLTLAPPQAGVVVRIVTFPPDAEWQAAGGYEDAMAAIGASDAQVAGEDAGVHATDTVDVVTMIEGEIHVVLETGEVVLRPGDTLVQRGTKHAWSNRSTGRATFVVAMYPASR